MRAIVRFTAISALALAAACRGGDDSYASVATDEPVQLGEGDVRITSRDGAVDLMLVGDRIIVGLSDSALEEIREQTDTTALEGDGGFGASIERFVKAKVQTTLAKRFDYPVSDLRDVSYDRGRIVFEYEDGKKFNLLEGAKSDDQPVLAAFSEEDSRAFVKAVRERIGARS
jgi:hypothetical protein